MNIVDDAGSSLCGAPGEVKPCPRAPHQPGADCPLCGGTGKRRVCTLTTCYEYGCQGGGNCDSGELRGIKPEEQGMSTQAEREYDALYDDFEKVRAERDTLRAEVERLREIREIASQCAANGGYLNSQDLIELRELLQLLREIAACANTTGSTPAA